MKLEVGKRYVRRDGTVTPPLVVDQWNSDWLCDPEHDIAYDNSFLGHQVFSFQEDECDLMEEYKGEE